MIKNSRVLKASIIALTLIAGAAQFGATAQAQNRATMTQFQKQQADYKAMQAANKLTCPRTYEILRYISYPNSPAQFICNYPSNGRYPKCVMPFSDAVQICVYTPVALAPAYDPMQRVDPSAVVSEIVQRHDMYFANTAENPVLFINVNTHEKSLGRSLKSFFDIIGKVAVPASDVSMPQNSGTGTAAPIATQLPEGGLHAFTSPDLAQENRRSADERVVPLVFKGKLKFANMSSLLFLRDEGMLRRFSTDLSTDPVTLEKQKLTFLNEIISKVKMTGYIDDSFTPVTGMMATRLGCNLYGAARVTVVDPSAIDITQSEIALGHQPRTDSEKSSAEKISFWFKTLGVAPYFQPAVSQGNFDDSITGYINSRMLTCQRQPGTSDLPDLAKVAPHFLKEVESSLVRTTTREMHAWHWMPPERVLDSDKLSTTPSSADPRVLGYLDAHWRKFFFEPNQGDNAGNGLYFSLTPPTTQGYGNLGVDLDIPKGTRFVTLVAQNFRASPEAITEVSDLKCTLQYITGLSNFFGSSTPACLNIARALALQLHISMTVYSYRPSRMASVCTDPSTPAWSLVVFDPALMNAAHVTMFNTTDTTAISNLSIEQKMIKEFLNPNTYYNYGGQAQASSTTSTTPGGVTGEQFSKWVNSEILGCGMGRDWINSWQ